MRELQRQADPSIVIMLVGNKTDMDSQRKTSREIGEQYAKEEGLLFAEASAKTGEGVEELFMEIGSSLVFFISTSSTDFILLQLRSFLLPRHHREGKLLAVKVSKYPDRKTLPPLQHVHVKILCAACVIECFFSYVSGFEQYTYLC